MTKSHKVRVIVRGTYDLQKLRISTGNRIAGNFRAKLGQEPGKSAADTLDAEAKALLKALADAHRRITDAIIALPKRAAFPGDELISDYTDYALVGSYLEMEQMETTQFKRLQKVLADFPIYTGWLADIRGIGPAMAGVIISEIDISKARYPSSLWAYAGLDVAHDGRGRSLRKEHLVDVDYKNAKGESATRKSITYNPWLKTKLMGVLAPSFLRSVSPYREIYDQYRHRIETDPRRECTDKPGAYVDQPNVWSKGRRHAAAQRYMVKMFLRDLYVQWRTIEGLPVSPTYQEAKQGHRHSKAA